MLNKNLKIFIQNLIKEAGMEKLPNDLQKQIYNDLEVRLIQRLYFFALNNLNENQIQELESLIKKGDQEEITRFLLLNIKDYSRKSNEVLKKFKDDYLKVVKNI